MTEAAPFRYDGKRAVVVGCSAGIGAATARIVQSLGGRVHGVGRTEPDDELVGFIRCDLRDPAQIDSAIARLDAPVDALFYNAGLMMTEPPLDVMKVNFAAMRAFVEGVHPLLRRGAAIAVVSSSAGFQYAEHMEAITELLATQGFAGAMAWCEENTAAVADGYVLSKQAAVVYTMRRAVEVADSGVRVNCFSPGPTDTPMLSAFLQRTSPEAFPFGPMRRAAHVDEMAWPLAFLNSDAASYITGSNLSADGGFVASVLTGAVDVAATRVRGSR